MNDDPEITMTGKGSGWVKLIFAVVLLGAGYAGKSVVNTVTDETSFQAAS